jgi:hypothetical protein
MVYGQIISFIIFSACSFTLLLVQRKEQSLDIIKFSYHNPQQQNNVDSGLNDIDYEVLCRKVNERSHCSGIKYGVSSSNISI